jgi:hypothetical protein
MPELHDVVRVLEDLPDLNLRTGDVGTVVTVFTEPEAAFEVEFVDDEGRTVATHALLPEQVEVAPAQWSPPPDRAPPSR